MPLGYEIKALLSGFEVIEDTTYSYSKQKGRSELKYIKQPFKYLTEIKVDGYENRAFQLLKLSDDRPGQKMSVDFKNARITSTQDFDVSVPQCEVNQFNGSLMSVA